MFKKQTEELNRITPEEYKNIKKKFVIVADNIRSLNNIGSLFRTGDAFGAEAVYLCGITASPPNKEIHKTALGAELSVDWEYFKETQDAIAELKITGFIIVAVEQVYGSVNLNELEIDSGCKYAFIFGNEVNGVGQNIVDISDICVEIPQIGTKHSLNVSVSAGIVLWEFFKQIR